MANIVALLAFTLLLASGQFLFRIDRPAIQGFHRIFKFHNVPKLRSAGGGSGVSGVVVVPEAVGRRDVGVAAVFLDDLANEFLLLGHQLFVPLHRFLDKGAGTLTYRPAGLGGFTGEDTQEYEQ